jgi:alkylation response protein AidB-like acyl-CoA dehydrogenase
MDFDWEPESLSLHTAAVEFGASLNRGVLDDDRAGRFPADKWARLAEWGYFGLCVPEEFGGADANSMTGLLVTEGLGEGCHDGGLLFSAAVQAWVVIPALLRFGSDEQKRRYLPELARGSCIGALAITEPDTGSDAFAMRTRATAVDGGWSLAGRKTMITNGPEARLVVCFAATGSGGALGGISVLLVDPEAPGVERGPSMEKMGLRTSPLCDLVFDDAFVAEQEILGEVGGGLLVFNDVLEWERIWPSALQIGAMQRDLDQARSYAKQRRAFGAPISSFQSVANRIVDMNVRLEAARLLTYRAAWVKARRGRAGAESAMAKLFASEAAVNSSLDLVQVHGGYGYMTETGVERRVRDAVGSRIYSGTSEMQRAALGRALGL